MTQLVTSLATELQEHIQPHVSIIDARRVYGVEQRAFDHLGRYVRERSDELRQKVLRLALIRADNMAGALVTGFFDVFPRPFPAEVFLDFEPACSWLAFAGAPRQVQDALDAVHSEASAVPPLLLQVRAVISKNLMEPNMDRACRELGLSLRTLQRSLRNHGTSFKSEVNEARLSAAKQRLLDTGDPISTIALDVGFATPQHFSTLFRRITGQSPSDWRRYHGSTRSR